MAHRISVSRAARIAGVSRSTIQRAIRDGTLATFEGEVLVADLESAYPDVSLEDDTVLERMSRIQEQSLNKATRATRADPRDLIAEINQLRLELQDTRERLHCYEGLIIELKQRLITLQNDDECTRHQKLIIQALISWMLTRMEHHA